MIDFDEELKHYKPKTEVADTEDVIHKRELTDLVDVLREIRGENGSGAPRKGGSV